MKTLLLGVACLLLLTSANAITISAVKPFFGTLTCISRTINSGNYAVDVATAAGYATSTPLFTNNPSAIFLTGNTGGNIQARGKSHGATKFITQVQ